ncbi:hypothetical protein [Magnetospira sp. QH-2]|uniref:hypothetical protein n=1 Tax=Magnetospira sp. (strain QH-2) TaxID=1288970 RepID=UPI0003E81A77|nr:hypothetical protein [Magnetospira sp. QH-2]CCQ75209.1 protein of unknown function [Magnetospira sp. QH-2]
MTRLPGEAYRTAARLIDEQGPKEARRHAQKRANELLEARDFEGSATWKAVLDAVRELAYRKPGPGLLPN